MGEIMIMSNGGADVRISTSGGFVAITLIDWDGQEEVTEFLPNRIPEIVEALWQARDQAQAWSDGLKE